MRFTEPHCFPLVFHWSSSNGLDILNTFASRGSPLVPAMPAAKELFGREGLGRDDGVGMPRFFRLAEQQASIRILMIVNILNGIPVGH